MNSEQLFNKRFDLEIPDERHMLLKHVINKRMPKNT